VEVSPFVEQERHLLLLRSSAAPYWHFEQPIVTAFVPQPVKLRKLLLSGTIDEPQRDSEVELHVESDAPTTPKHPVQSLRRFGSRSFRLVFHPYPQNSACNPRGKDVLNGCVQLKDCRAYHVISLSLEHPSIEIETLMLIRLIEELIDLPDLAGQPTNLSLDGSVVAPVHGALSPFPVMPKATKFVILGIVLIMANRY
jgi:hypothetical protein